MRRSASAIVASGAALMSTPPSAATTTASSSSVAACTPLATQIRRKGDFNSNLFHNSNPEHGGAYDQQERKARDDEIEDFLLSVKGWTHNPNTDAIKKTFVFESFDTAYEFMGRLFAFCWGVDKYTPVTWHGNAITVELYSAHFKGLSKRELKIAAFCNDHFNMIKKSAQQVGMLHERSAQSSVEALVGDGVRRATDARDRFFNEPAPESAAAASAKATTKKPASVDSDWGALFGGGVAK